MNSGDRYLIGVGREMGGPEKDLTPIPTASLSTWSSLPWAPQLEVREQASRRASLPPRGGS